MALIVDAHVHLYPGYQLELALKSACENLNRLILGHGLDPRETAKALFLTERHDCRAFRELKHDAKIAGEFSPVLKSDSDFLRFESPKLGAITIVPGRQIVSQERLEVLCYLKDLEIPNGLPIRELIEQIRKAQGIPVINWAPGKWLFERGKIVSELLENSAPGSFLICDTSLRPKLFALPSLMRLAQKKGFALVFGTDPFPFAGEESRIGTYATVFQDKLEADSLVRAFSKPYLQTKSLGQRLNLAQVIYRVGKLKL